MFNILCLYVLVAQSCPTLCNPTDYGPPGSSVRRILQAGFPCTKEYLIIAYNRRRVQLGDWGTIFSDGEERRTKEGLRTPREDKSGSG